MAQQEPPFVPKQASPRTPPYMKLVIGDATTHVAQSLISEHISPFPAGSVVHDNGCGTGVVTTTILSSSSSSSADIKIEATDVNPAMVQMTKSILGAKGWDDRANAAVMNAEELSFPDATFSHSFANFLIYTGPDPRKVAAEMRRTLRAGGRAYVSCWSDVVHDAAMLEAHARTRPAGTAHPLASKQVWKDAGYLEKVLGEAGFGGVEVVPADGFLEIKDLREWISVAWTFLGAAAGGWTREDEERWDEAVDVMYELLSKSDRLTKQEDGSYRYRMGANVAIATK